VRRPDDVIAGPVQHEDGLAQRRQPSIATAERRRKIPELEGAIELNRRAHALGLVELAQEGAELGVAPGAGTGAQPALQRAVLRRDRGDRSRAESWGGEQPLVPEAPLGRGGACGHADEWVSDVERDVGPDPLRGQQAQQEADPATPVVPGESHVPKLERIEQRQKVTGELLLVVAARRRL
jgi:hypothetical protein